MPRGVFMGIHLGRPLLVPLDSGGAGPGAAPIGLLIGGCCDTGLVGGTIDGVRDLGF